LVGLTSQIFVHHRIFHFPKSLADFQRHETSSECARYLGVGGGGHALKKYSFTVHL
jgi:hypothetical protein